MGLRAVIQVYERDGAFEERKQGYGENHPIAALYIGSLPPKLRLLLPCEAKAVDVFWPYPHMNKKSVQFPHLGLTLTYNESGPLAKLGLLELVRRHDQSASPSNRHWIFHSNGDLLGEWGHGERAREMRRGGPTWGRNS